MLEGFREAGCGCSPAIAAEIMSFFSSKLHRGQMASRPVLLVITGLDPNRRCCGPGRHNPGNGALSGRPAGWIKRLIRTTVRKCCAYKRAGLSISVGRSHRSFRA